MEIGNEKVREYLIALKEKGHFSYEDIANLSGTPVQTVRNYCTGKTPNPSFATVANMIISLGGDLNEIIGYERKKEIEVNSTVSMKETYEMRIADIIKSYEARIEDIKALCDQRVEDVRKCYEMRIADIKQGIKEMYAEQKEMTK